MKKIIKTITDFLNQEYVPDKSFTKDDGDELSEYEKYILIKTQKCPDCGHGQLCKGASGGMSVNFRCSQCDGSFNIGPLLGKTPSRFSRQKGMPVWAQRISNRNFAIPG